MAIIKILVTFLLIILLLRRKLNLGPVMLIASALLGILFGLGPLQLIQTAVHGAVAGPTLSLMSALVLIMFLEDVMRRTEMLQQMLDSFKALVGDRRLVMAFMPALMGLLPSAGGARFSCPLVDESSRGSDFTPEQKSFVNFWFRHVWEYILPLYPSILIYNNVTGTPISQIVLYQLPFAALTLIVGFGLAFGRFKPSRPRLSRRENLKQLSLLLLSIWPILAALALAIVFKLEVWLCILIVLLLLFVAKGCGPRSILLTVRTSFSLKIIVLTLGVMIFKQMLDATGAVAAVTEYSARSGVPQLVLVTVLPLAIGVLTGVTQAVVAILFPILWGITHEPTMFTVAFVSGFAGIMLSPVHLCLVLTVDYFKTTMDRIYNKLILGESILVGAAILFALLYR